MSLVQPITPHLWFDTQAREAATFYASLFPDSGIDALIALHNTPSGDCEVVEFHLGGQPFMAISAGPHFRFNPSISFLVHFDTARETDALGRQKRTWEALLDGGQALMPLGEYPFSPSFGWVQDRFGLSWQLMLGEFPEKPVGAIVPALMFTGAVSGQAEEAGAFYRSLFEASQAGQLQRFGEGMPPHVPGSVMYSDFSLGGKWFAAMDGGSMHDFGFNEAVSFMLVCPDQSAVDQYWSQLSAVPAAEQCGWCKDRFGVSWQVAPARLGEIMRSGDQAAIDRVTQAFLPMHKLDLVAIDAAARTPEA